MRYLLLLHFALKNIVLWWNTRDSHPRKRCAGTIRSNLLKFDILLPFTDRLQQAEDCWSIDLKSKYWQNNLGDPIFFKSFFRSRYNCNWAHYMQKWGAWYFLQISPPTDRQDITKIFVFIFWNTFFFLKKFFKKIYKVLNFLPDDIFY
jgi:hypothetical protein